MLMSLFTPPGQTFETFSGIDPHESIATGGTRLRIFGHFSGAAHQCRFVDVRNSDKTMTGEIDECSCSEIPSL